MKRSDNTTIQPPAIEPPANQPSGKIRDYCVGELPLAPRLDPWMTSTLENLDLAAIVAQHGSPINLISTNPMVRNIHQLEAVAAERAVPFRIYFARKSNKCLALVQTAIDNNIGIDTASENEVQQSLDVGADPANLICTAAVKSETLLNLCLKHSICIAVDNLDELDLITVLARERGERANIALRLGGFDHQGRKLPTRFGFDVASHSDTIHRIASDVLNVTGVHFHLDGYDASQRVSAICQSLEWIEQLRFGGHNITFLDMGGGFPMSYLMDEHQWSSFWKEHERAILGRRPAITYRNHTLGKYVHNHTVVGAANSYPYFQTPVRASWFAGVLDCEVDGQSIAARLKAANLQLRCEPGRSLLDGCGMTIARVEFRKRTADGDWLIGLSMNRTQCRTSSDDFLVDPILLPSSDHRSESISGYLVGAYCTEFELISLRRLRFPHGVRRGDLVAFPNTAGYLMHFLESRSHQFPLAKNLVVTEGSAVGLDPIERQ
jgi:diaminopimelate decarboxylase